MELHCSVKVVGRGEQGRTACGSSAYRACNVAIDNEGIVHDFRNKSGHAGGGVVLPAGAPAELLDRQILWQRHDAKERRRDAQIFREVEFNYHCAFGLQQAGAVAQDVCRRLAEQGMCCQWDLHDKTNDKGERNLHCHIMLTMRELLDDGTFGNKNRDWNRYNGGANLADELRPLVAELQNQVLARHGIADRVEHESYEARGIDRVPTVHEGVAARAMAAKGQLTYKVRLNAMIAEINREHLAYVERLQRYREARAELSAMVLQEAQERHDGLDWIISGADALRDATDAPDALREPLPPTSEEIYQTIRAINGQAAGLRKDAQKLKKMRQALYTAKNLIGVQGLDANQKDQLRWATGYLRWAGMEDLSPKAINEAIDRFREINTSGRVEQIRLAAAKDQAYADLRALRTENKTKSLSRSSDRWR